MVARQRSLQWSLIALGVGVVLVALAGIAYACTPQANIQLDVSRAEPGETVTGSGHSFESEEGKREAVVTWNGDEDHVLWSDDADEDGNITFSFEVPDVEPGGYVITARSTNWDGDPAREGFEVPGDSDGSPSGDGDPQGSNQPQDDNAGKHQTASGGEPSDSSGTSSRSASGGNAGDSQAGQTSMNASGGQAPADSGESSTSDAGEPSGSESSAPSNAPAPQPAPDAASQPDGAGQQEPATPRDTAGEQVGQPSDAAPGDAATTPRQSVGQAPAEGSQPTEVATAPAEPAPASGSTAPEGTTTTDSTAPESSAPADGTREPAAESSAPDEPAGGVAEEPASASEPSSAQEGQANSRTESGRPSPQSAGQDLWGGLNADDAPGMLHGSTDAAGPTDNPSLLLGAGLGAVGLMVLLGGFAVPTLRRRALARADRR